MVPRRRSRTTTIEVAGPGRGRVRRDGAVGGEHRLPRLLARDGRPGAPGRVARSWTKTSERSPEGVRTSDVNAIRRPSADSRGSEASPAPRRRPHALQRAGAHVAHDDVGARLRALGVLVGLEGDEAAVARDRRVVRRPRGRAAPGGSRTGSGPCAGRGRTRPSARSAWRSSGCRSRTRRPPSARPRTSPGCSWSSAGPRSGSRAAAPPAPGRGPSPRSRRASWRS